LSAAQSPAAGSGIRPGGSRRPRSPKPAVVAGTIGGVVAAALITAAVLLWTGAISLHASPPSWQPGTINNLVVQGGPFAAYGPSNLLTRTDGSRPLSVPEMRRVFPPRWGNRDTQLSSDCAAAVLGRAIRKALAAGRCTQVVRMVVTGHDSTGAHYISQIDIFNLKNSLSVYRVAEELGEISPYQKGLDPRIPPNAAPRGFIKQWPGTLAAHLARATVNGADINSYGHFLIVIWTEGGTEFSQGLISGNFENIVSNFGE
jgi:hypothetical protein